MFPRTISRGKIRGESVRRFVNLGLLSFFGASTLVSAATLCVNPSGKFGCYSTISAAVAAASPGDTISTWKGTYKRAGGDHQVPFAGSGGGGRFGH